MQFINLIANIFLTFGLILFIIFVYGRDSMICKLPYLERVSIRLALSITACGALYNVLTMPITNTPQVIFNTGLAIVFVWASWFHYKYFIKK